VCEARMVRGPEVRRQSCDINCVPCSKALMASDVVP
jgi:hypothetical protein